MRSKRWTTILGIAAIVTFLATAILLLVNYVLIPFDDVAGEATRIEQLGIFFSLAIIVLGAIFVFNRLRTSRHDREPGDAS